ncbi:MAG: serine/threonine protein kinase [Phycisphaerae bacterium]|nr:serine/threonine protein kinase [Phycisphaerae bacterium]
MASRIPHPDELLGQRFGSYRLVELIGKSSVSSVYRAQDVVLGRSVAVKVMPPWTATSDQERIERFLNEVRAAAQLQHPHVVTTYHVGQHDRHHYVVMELMSGGSLQDVLDRGQRLSPTAAATAIRQASRGLAAAHRAGIIHRDIKPSNLLMTGEGVVKVADFGLANRLEVVGESGTASVVEGTPRYVAPELCLGHPPSLASDIYALGMTWYALLTGGPAFGGKNSHEIFRKHLRAPVPDITRMRPDVPAEQADLLFQCLAKLPEDRFDSAETFLKTLDATMDPVTVTSMDTVIARESASLRDLIMASRAAAVEVRRTAAATTRAAASANGQAEPPSVWIPIGAWGVLGVLIIIAILFLWRMLLSG